MIDLMQLTTAFGVHNMRRNKGGTFKVYANSRICHRPVSGQFRSIEIDLYDDELDAYCFKCNKDVSEEVVKYIRSHS